MPEKLTWHNEKRKVKDLIPYEGNPKILTERQKQYLIKSIKKFNLTAGPKINTDNTVIAGHQVLKILNMLGWAEREIDVRVPNRPLTQKELREMLLMDNKTQEMGTYELDLLANFTPEELKEAGWTEEELDQIFGLETVVEDEFDALVEAEKIKKPKTKPGEIIKLGPHRLMCGDATKREDVAKLMGKEKGQMVFTDPPYNVNYDYETKFKFKGRRDPISHRRIKGSEGAKIFSDNQTPEQFYNFLLKAFKNFYEFTENTMAIYVCYATRSQNEFFNAFRDAGFHLSQTIIWLKDRIILALGQDYHGCYEPILFGWKKGKVRYTNTAIHTEKEVWDLDKKTFAERLDVWYIKRDKSKDYRHPTQKPIRLAERAIKKNSIWGSIVLDFFGGSGSTLLACEQLGRRCYMMELDPVYCDVIKIRYNQFVDRTTRKAQKTKK